MTGTLFVRINVTGVQENDRQQKGKANIAHESELLWEQIMNELTYTLQLYITFVNTEVSYVSLNWNNHQKAVS